MGQNNHYYQIDKSYEKDKSFIKCMNDKYYF